jgi:hypothetical protein
LIRYPFECGHITQYKDVIFDGQDSPPPGDGESSYCNAQRMRVFQPPLSGEYLKDAPARA